MSTIKPILEAQMLVRRPAAVVFEAFTNPEVTTNFWFSRSSGNLEPGKAVTWEWEMYNVFSKVTVIEVLPHSLIKIEWGDPATIVEFHFKALDTDSTYVVIKNHGFIETGDELIQVVMDSTGGFTTVLDGLKAYLEHGIQLNLIADKFPPGI